MTDQAETSTRVDVDPEDVIFVPHEVRPLLRDIAARHVCPYDDAAHAFRTLRPVMVSDAETVKSVAMLAGKDATQLPELAYAMVGMLGAKERAEARAFRNRDGTGGIVVPGGATGPALPPERAFDGTPDPEVGRMLAEGQARYHLDTLKELEAESHRGMVAEDPKVARRAAAKLSPLLSLATMAALVASPLGGEELEGTSTRVDAKRGPSSRGTAPPRVPHDARGALDAAEEKRARKAAKRLAEAERCRKR